ncbi:hypothetical protein BGZ65_004938, partial [Modicella reniformis]
MREHTTTSYKAPSSSYKSNKLNPADTYPGFSGQMTAASQKDKDDGILSFFSEDDLRLINGQIPSLEDSLWKKEEEDGEDHVVVVSFYHPPTNTHANVEREGETLLAAEIISKFPLPGSRPAKPVQDVKNSQDGFQNLSQMMDITPAPALAPPPPVVVVDVNRYVPAHQFFIRSSSDLEVVNDKLNQWLQSKSFKFPWLPTF